MSAVRGGPTGRLGILVGSLVGAGAVLYAAAAYLAARGDSPLPPGWRVAVVGAAFLLGDAALLHVRFRHDKLSFTWSEAAVVVGLAWVGDPWLPLVGGLGVAAAHLLARRAPIKVAFNASSCVIGLYAARGVFTLVAGASGPFHASVRNYAALAVAAVVFSAWNTTAAAAAVSLSQGQRLREVYRRAYALRLIGLVGNVAIGIVTIAVGEWNPATLAVVPFFVVLLCLAYRGNLIAQQQRDMWQRLQAAAADLTQVNEGVLVEVILSRAAELFSAEFVEVRLRPSYGAPTEAVHRWRADGVATLAGTSTPSPASARAAGERSPYVVSIHTAPEPQARELAALGLESAVIAPLTTAAGFLGTLLIGFSGMVRLDRRELRVLSTYASHVTIALDHMRLFQEVSDQGTRLRQIIDNSSDGILSVDASGAVTSWNAAMARITGRAADEVLGAPLSLALVATAEGVPVNGQWLRNAVADDDHLDAYLVARAADAGQRHLAVSVAAVKAPTGEHESAVLIVRDVTRLREAEEAKQDFLATVSHELRTPLTSLKGFASTLLRPDYEPTAEQLAHCHDRMLYQTSRLERLVEDLLSVSTAERGEFSVVCEPNAVDDVIEKVVQDHAAHNPTRPVEQLRAGLAGLAICDAGRLEQVVANLVSNADKYSAAGEPITVSAERQGDVVCISVADRGPGISEDNHEAVFLPFHRLGHHLRREVRGSGLGLHIARRLVDAMHGRIWVESRLGEGSVFKVALPAAPLVAGARAAS
ncbi:MAG: ATP-binding protein [Mycobacteriales bacterium]|nr:PAS domain-containing sensor histidine kinase [Frankia sp.]